MSEPTPSKAQLTREKIVEASLSLFARKGYTESTMRDIAKEAGVSLGLTYRYFGRKEELVLALYEDLSREAVQSIKGIRGGTLATRYPQALTHCIAALQPHRSTLGALFSAGLSTDSSVAVFGENASGVRLRMWDAFKGLAQESTDAPKPDAVERFATLLYAGHLITILFWLQDRSEDQVNTIRLLNFYEKVLKLGRPFLKMKIVNSLVEEFVQIIEPMFVRLA